MFVPAAIAGGRRTEYVWMPLGALAISYLSVSWFRIQKEAMPSVASQPQNRPRLVENGLKQIELPLEAIVYQPAAPTLRPQIGRLWQSFLEQGEQRGSLLSRRRLISVQSAAGQPVGWI